MTTGENLNVLILANYSLHHDWMAFASWYSISKMLPDAQVGILCNRKPLDSQLFNWAKKCNVKIRYHQQISKEEQIQIALNEFLSFPLMVVTPDLMMLRELDSLNEKVCIIDENNENFCDAKEEKVVTFVSYANGWGKFEMSSWIDKPNHPFRYNWSSVGMNINEVKIEKIWKKCSNLYNILR